MAGPRGEFLARLRRFADMTLDRLGEASRGKDVDEKETRMLGNLVLKVLRIWEKALHGETPGRRLEDSLLQAEKEASGAEKGED